MTEYIAVAPVSVLPGIKRHLLLFDKVAVVQSEHDWSFRAEDPSLAADLDWLESKGLIFRVEEFLKKECGFEIRSRKRQKTIFLKLIAVPQHKIKEVREACLGGEFALKFDGKRVSEVLSGIDDLACRWEAHRLRDSAGVEAISISSPRTEISELLGVKSGQGDVMRVLLKSIPEPSPSASLEQILQFRQDPESKEKMVAFRRWARTMLARKTPEKEIVEELDWLAHEYTEHMRFHRMKINKGIVEIIVTTAAEVAEDLVKIKWGKLAKLLFSLQHRQIDLLEAEMKAPGREIAYVVQARKEFRQ